MWPAGTVKKRLTGNCWVLLFALAYAVIVFAVSPVYAPLFDSATYSDIASSLVSGRGYLLVGSPAGDVPLLPVILASFMLAFGEAWAPAYLSLASFLMIISVFCLAEELRKGTGLISALLLSTMALPVMLSLQVLTDALFLVFVGSGVILLRRFLRASSWRNALLFSVVVSLSYLLRPTGLFLIGFAVVACLWNLLRRRVQFQKFMALVMIAVLVVGSWELAGGKITSVQGGMEGKAKTATLSFSVADPYNGDISFAGDVPVQAGNLVRMGALLIMFVMPAMLLVFAWDMWRPLRRRDGEAWFMLVLVAAFLLPHLTVIPSLVARYLMPVLPVFIVVFADFIRRNWGKKRAVVLVLVIMHLGTAWFACQWYYARTEHLTTGVFEESGAWMNRNLPSGRFLLSGMGATEFHYYSGLLPVEEAPADFVIKSNMSEPGGVTAEGMGLCKRFDDGFYWVEIWGRSC
jgi:4-amino-4-deoxy-L-arabinose transferase-like glycosyltransferase